MALRPRYETTDDRAREASVAYKVALHFRLAVSRTNELSPDDWKMSLHDGTPFAVLEVKTRPNYAWADLNRLGTYMLSANKWKALRIIAERDDLKICLAVADKFEEVRCATFSRPWPEFDIKVGGREDRGDPMDKELCIHIPTQLFTHEVRVADQTDLDSLEQVLACAQALIRKMKADLPS